MKRPKTKTTKKERKPWTATRTPKPKKKPARRIHCPGCGHGTFNVTPFVLPELQYEHLDNGDVVVKLEDYLKDERDELTCGNCGWYGTWPQAGD